MYRSEVHPAGHSSDNMAVDITGMDDVTIPFSSFQPVSRSSLDSNYTNSSAVSTMSSVSIDGRPLLPDNPHRTDTVPNRALNAPNAPGSPSITERLSSFVPFSLPEVVSSTLSSALSFLSTGPAYPDNVDSRLHAMDMPRTALQNRSHPNAQSDHGSSSGVNYDSPRVPLSSMISPEVHDTIATQTGGLRRRAGKPLPSTLPFPLSPRSSSNSTSNTSTPSTNAGTTVNTSASSTSNSTSSRQYTRETAIIRPSTGAPPLHPNRPTNTRTTQVPHANGVTNHPASANDDSAGTNAIEGFSYVSGSAKIMLTESGRKVYMGRKKERLERLHKKKEDKDHQAQSSTLVATNSSSVTHVQVVTDHPPSVSPSNRSSSAAHASVAPTDTLSSLPDDPVDLRDLTLYFQHVCLPVPGIPTGVLKDAALRLFEQGIRTPAQLHSTAVQDASQLWKIFPLFGITKLGTIRQVVANIQKTPPAVYSRPATRAGTATASLKDIVGLDHLAESFDSIPLPNTL